MELEKRLFVASLAGDGNVPSELRLFQAGVNQYSDGDKIVFDGEAAESVMARYQERGIDLMADYEHQSLQRPPIEAPASAKKWTPEVRGGDLMATNIAWTDRAKSMIAAGEYRYYSIAAKVDPKTGRALEVINFALTNNPAAIGIAPLKAASALSNQELQMSEPSTGNHESLFIALGLKPDADSESAVALAGELAQMKRQVMAITKTASISDALGAVAANASSAEIYKAAEAKLYAIEKAQREKEFDTLMKQADMDGKMPPALAKSEWAQGLRSSNDGVTQLKSYLDRAPVLVNRKPVVEETDELENVELSDVEVAIAKKRIGDDPVALKKRLDDLRAQKLEDIRTRKAARR